jgi:integrase
VVILWHFFAIFFAEVTNMKRKWINSKRFTGIRWQNHPSRKNGVKYDRNFGYRFMVKGKQHEGLLGWETEGWTEEKAFLKRKQYIKNAKTGNGPVSPTEEDKAAHEKSIAQKQKEISFEDYFNNKYLPEAQTRKQESTLKSEKQHLRDWIAPILEGKPMHLISPDDIETIKLSILKKGRARRTAQHILAVFRLVWNHAKKRGIVDTESPTTVIDIGRIDNARTRFLTPTEAQKLLKRIKKLDSNAYALTLAALYTGARLGELTVLTWSNVDMQERSIKLLHTKTDQPRVLPIAGPLYDLLRKLPRQNLDSLIFTNSAGNFWKEAPWAFRHAVKQLKFNEGREKRDWICFHSLRHTAASMMLAAGVDGRTIQTHFGWSTLSMIERYTHVLDDSKRKAVDNLEKALEG